MEAACLGDLNGRAANAAGAGVDQHSLILLELEWIEGLRQRGVIRRALADLVFLQRRKRFEVCPGRLRSPSPGEMSNDDEPERSVLCIGLARPKDSTPGP